MSGVVDTAKKAVGSAAAATIDAVHDVGKKPLKGIAELYTGFLTAPLAGIGGAVGASRTAGATVDGAGPVAAAGVGMRAMAAPFMADQAKMPNIAIQDPSAVNAANDAKRAAAMRQAQIDQMTGAPGRGGTVLTDKYTYNT